MEPDLNGKIAARFKELPRVVQNAIRSAEVEQHLRALAETHKLHLDQWSILENEVMLALLGFQKADELPQHIENEVGVSAEVAQILSADISKIVFEPIRQELERQLEHPAATAAKTTGVEDVRTQMLADAAPGTPVAVVQTPAPAPTPLVTPATPPPTAPSIQVERTPASVAYTPATPSHERKTIDGDPYREQLD